MTLTAPLERQRPALVCTWCEIRLNAIPDQPVVYRQRRYHPTCVEAAEARIRAEALTRILTGV